MRYILLGLIAAMTFGLSATMILGPEALLANPWVDTVFWSLLGAGVLMQLAGETLRCQLCAVTQRVSSAARRCHDHRCLPS